jgi:hypothetical protein
MPESNRPTKPPPNHLSRIITVLMEMATEHLM